MMTVQKCLAICGSKGFEIAGLARSFECQCGNMPEDDFEWAWSEMCNDPCSGESTQTCGGSNALSLWTTIPDYLDGFCIEDFPDKRVLNDRKGSWGGMETVTLESCRNFCKGSELQKR